MGASCCQKTIQINSQELVIDASDNKPYTLNKESLLQQNQQLNKEEENVDKIKQEYSKEEIPLLEKMKKSVPALKISNTRGSVTVLQASNPQEDSLMQKADDQFNSLEIVNKFTPPQNPNTNPNQTPNSRVQHSPSSRKQSQASLQSISLKLGVELFVNLKKGSISKTYTTGQVLGQGAFGKVWKVTHKTTGLVRAMKQIKKSELIKEEEQKLFAEMNILKNLDHPHIVKLYELYQDANNYYLITEYLSGGELFDRIKKMTHFSERKASDYIRQILMAIVYCHDQKIVHRDLKPENVLFVTTDNDADLKVIDFGCSRKLTGKSMTKRLGTPYYIAPEVLQQHYNEKCDVWSCGVILYILLCGYPPFTGRSEAEIFEKVKQGKVKFPPEDWDNISREAKNLIQKMLMLEPVQRYSALQALQDPWISKHAPSTSINKKVLEQLSGFQAKSFFKQAVVQYIVSQMSTNKELEDLKNSFKFLDKNHDGILSKEELIEGYQKILKSKLQAEEEVEKILSLIDTNHSGRVDYSEFVSAALNQQKIISLKKVEQAFKIFDQDGDGFITKSELEMVMGEIDNEVWTLILSETDKNNDGKISQEEFQRILMNFEN